MNRRDVFYQGLGRTKREGGSLWDMQTARDWWTVTWIQSKASERVLPSPVSTKIAIAGILGNGSGVIPHT